MAEKVDIRFTNIKYRKIMAYALMASLVAVLNARADSVCARNPEGNYIVPGVLGNIVYKRSGGAELSLDAYVQKTGKQVPGVIVAHGGSWTSGSRITYVAQLLELLTKSGYNWFSLDYRLAPADKFPAALEDLRDALAFIRSNARSFRIDPQRIVLMGEDAGAHLAALLAQEKPPGLCAVVLFGAPLELASMERFQKGGPDTPLAQVFGPNVLDAEAGRILAKASPIRQITGGLPPFLIVHGTQDREVPPEQPKLYCDLSRNLGNRCEVLFVEGGIHALENWRPDQWGYKPRVMEWLAKVASHSSPQHPPGKKTPYGSRLQKDLVYGSYVDRNSIRKDLCLDAYRPEGLGPFPAVILAHGGGWEAGDKVTYLTPVLEPLARAGFAWFSIDYRLTPEFRNQDQLDDVRRAIRFVRRNSRRFRIDPGRIALLGESASGQLVTQVAAEPCNPEDGSPDAVNRQSCRVQSVVSFYGVYDFTAMVTDASPRSLLVRLFGITVLDAKAREVLRRYSPLHQAGKSMPPTLLIHGTNERLWAQGQSFEKRLTEIGVPHELLALEGAPHGMENWEGHPAWMHYKSKLVDWLAHHLGRRAAP